TRRTLWRLDGTCVGIVFERRDRERFLTGARGDLHGARPLLLAGRGGGDGVLAGVGGERDVPGLLPLLLVVAHDLEAGGGRGHVERQPEEPGLQRRGARPGHALAIGLPRGVGRGGGLAEHGPGAGEAAAALVAVREEQAGADAGIELERPLEL